MVSGGGLGGEGGISCGGPLNSVTSGRNRISRVALRLRFLLRFRRLFRSVAFFLLMWIRITDSVPDRYPLGLRGPA